MMTFLSKIPVQIKALAAGVLVLALLFFATYSDADKLEGSKYKLERVVVVDGQIYDNYSKVIEFRKDGELYVKDGINNYHGDWDVDEKYGYLDLNYNGTNYEPYEYEIDGDYLILRFNLNSDGSDRIVYYKKLKK